MEKEKSERIPADPKDPVVQLRFWSFIEDLCDQHGETDHRRRAGQREIEEPEKISESDFQNKHQFETFSSVKDSRRKESSGNDEQNDVR